MDVEVKLYGQVNTLLNMAYIFIECGCVNEARKLFQVSSVVYNNVFSIVLLQILQWQWLDKVYPHATWKCC